MNGYVCGRIGPPKQSATSQVLRLKNFKKYFHFRRDADNLIVSKLSSAECQPELPMRFILDQIPVTKTPKEPADQPPHMKPLSERIAEQVVYLLKQLS